MSNSHMTIASILIGIFVFGSSFFAVSPSSRAEFYQYMDKTGKRVFVDDPGKIPEEYRNSAKTYTEKYDHLTPEERMRLKRKEDQESLANEARLQQLARKKSLKNIQTPVVIKNNRVLVPVHLGYRGTETEAILVLDTGASVIALHRDVADRLYIQDTKAAKMRVFGGTILDTRVAVLDHVRVGPYLKKNLHAGIIDPVGEGADHNGLLGMNFLKGLNYTIDFDEQIIFWNP